MAKTMRKRVNPRKSQAKGVDIPYEKTLVCRFLEMLHAIKLFHWRTTSYAIHKATCELHSKETVQQFKTELIAMNSKMDVSVNSDLLNIRDEMVGHINQFLYLLTLS